MKLKSWGLEEEEEEVREWNWRKVEEAIIQHTQIHDTVTNLLYIVHTTQYTVLQLQP